MNCGVDLEEAFWREIFKKADANNDGRISKKEFKKYMKKYGGSTFSAKDLQTIFSYCDGDGSGYIDFNEFIKFMQVGRSV
ncbi:unnamed protein product [Trichobilharzia szidati]|nr:unnamed protein product [Trichobilharzia szidati]